MRAVVVVNGELENGFFLMGDRYPASMLWLVDRPLIQRVCEALVGRGVLSVDWVYYRATECPRLFLGNGERWGADFRHHSADEFATPYPLVRHLLASHGSDGEVLFGHVDRTLTLPPIEPGRPDGGSIRLIESAQDGSWTGWAVLKGRILDQFPGHAFDRRDVEQFLYAGHAGSLERTAMPAGPEIRCMESYMSAVREVLAAACPGAEIRIPRSARVHPTARLTGPVFLGPGVEIGAEATVGPNVAVGPNSIVDRHTKLTNAVVMPDTFIGGRMWLDSAVVDRDRVVSPGPGGFVHVDREVPVASLADHPFTQLAPTALANRAKSVVRNLGGVPTRFFRKVLGTSGIRRSDQPIIEPVPAAAN